MKHRYRVIIVALISSFATRAFATERTIKVLEGTVNEANFSEFESVLSSNEHSIVGLRVQFDNSKSLVTSVEKESFSAHLKDGNVEVYAPRGIQWDGDHGFDGFFIVKLSEEGLMPVFGPSCSRRSMKRRCFCLKLRSTPFV